MSEPRLTYFDMSGLGEPVRLMLSLTKERFEDVRVNKDQWQELKPSLKWRFLPMLEIDGKVLFQSMSICRFLAQGSGLTGSKPEDALLCDMTVDNLNDMRARVAKFYYWPDSEERTEKLKDLAVTSIPVYLERFQEQLKDNDGYLVGGMLTWADVIFLAFSGYVSQMVGQDILEKFPDLKEHQEHLKELPRIKEWMDTRPPEPADFRVHFF